MVERAEPLSRALPGISLRDNWWVVIPIIVLSVALLGGLLWLLYYVHVFSAILWTGTDIFMGFILGPILRKVDIPTRRAIITRLMPRMLFYMPVISATSITAGYYLAQRLGFFSLPYPEAYWVLAAGAIAGLMTVQGLGVLLPINLLVYFEIRKEQPRGPRIQRLMAVYVRVVASQALLQLAIVAVMVNFRIGL